MPSLCNESLTLKLGAMKKILTYSDWNEQADKHEEEILTLVGDWKKARKNERKHPVIDFLFQYFSFPFNRLKAWSPGMDIQLEGPINEKLSPHRFEEKDGIICIKEDIFPYHRKKYLDWTITLLERTISNQACFNCYGLHEWAMVYKAETIRHQVTDLRLPAEEINAIVEEKELNCTHYDAYRFYTPKAVPLNKLSPTRETQETYEQSACLHANMDLYKWAYKMYPFISSDLLMKCFKLALDCRTVDMKASPYDLLYLGYEPIKIETPEGREEYVKQQLRLKKNSDPIRLELLNIYKKLKKLTSQI